MYCVRCGVKLAETERKCPLCHTAVCHPDFPPKAEEALYPDNKMPEKKDGKKMLNGAAIILLLVPLAFCLLSDIQFDGTLEWFGYVAGALLVSYVSFLLPLWFRKPNPVIFVPCGFAAAILYLLYIHWVTHGAWFLSFAFPVFGTLSLIVCALVTLLRYLQRGRLYIIGGALIALSGWMLLVEFQLVRTFGLPFIGWSFYPLAGLALLGGLCIHLAISPAAREVIRRKLFF